MLWGRPAWGVWWTWDARLTSTALLEILFIGYLALRRVPADPHARARRCAVLALLACLDVPIVHFSVQWWNGLHQGATVLDSGFHFHVHGSMLWTLLLSFVAFSCVFAWMVRRRYQLAVRDAAVEDAELAEAPPRAPRRGGPMSYVVWGYVVTLGVLAAYATSLVVRSRRP